MKQDHKMRNLTDPLKIDDILTLPDRVILAPMQGVMSPGFVSAAVETGIAGTRMTPFFSVGANSIPSGRALRRALKVWAGHESGPLIVQLAGCHADSLAETSYRLIENGYPYINLNFGCPGRLVMRSGHGGACLREPEQMDRILREIRALCGSRISLSVKLRTGYDTPDEMGHLADILLRNEIPLVILHFRTVAEQYGPVEDPLPRLRKFRQLMPGTILFGNGDIDSHAAALRMIQETGCDGVAVARAVSRDPFLLKKIREGKDSEPAREEKIRFLQTIFRHAGNEWRRNGFLENLRMCFGEDSHDFRRFTRLHTREEMAAEWISFAGQENGN